MFSHSMGRLFVFAQRYGHKLCIVVCLASCIFMLSGGSDVVLTYMNGASSYESYWCASTAPLFAGFVMMGLYGLMYANKNYNNARCLVGLGIAVFCYFVIEGLYVAM